MLASKASGMTTANKRWAARYASKVATAKRRALAEETEARSLHRRSVLGGMFSRTAHAENGSDVAKAIGRLRVPALKSF